MEDNNLSYFQLNQHNLSYFHQNTEYVKNVNQISQTQQNMHLPFNNDINNIDIVNKNMKLTNIFKNDCPIQKKTSSKRIDIIPCVSNHMQSEKMSLSLLLNTLSDSNCGVSCNYDDDIIDSISYNLFKSITYDVIMSLIANDIMIKSFESINELIKNTKKFTFSNKSYVCSKELPTIINKNGCTSYVHKLFNLMSKPNGDLMRHLSNINVQDCFYFDALYNEIFFKNLDDLLLKHCFHDDPYDVFSMIKKRNFIFVCSIDNITKLFTIDLSDIYFAIDNKNINNIQYSIYHSNIINDKNEKTIRHELLKKRILSEKIKPLIKNNYRFISKTSDCDANGYIEYWSSLLEFIIYDALKSINTLISTQTKQLSLELVSHDDPNMHSNKDIFHAISCTSTSFINANESIMTNEYLCNDKLMESILHRELSTSYMMKKYAKDNYNMKDFKKIEHNAIIHDLSYITLGNHKICDFREFVRFICKCNLHDNDIIMNITVESNAMIKLYAIDKNINKFTLIGSGKHIEIDSIKYTSNTINTSIDINKLIFSIDVDYFLNNFKTIEEIYVSISGYIVPSSLIHVHTINKHEMSQRYRNGLLFNCNFDRTNNVNFLSIDTEAKNEKNIKYFGSISTDDLISLNQIIY
jgi:hypothetical protein